MSKEFEETIGDWCSHDEWQFADRNAAWLFFFHAGRTLGRREFKEIAVQKSYDLGCEHYYCGHTIGDSIEAIPEEVEK